MGLYTKIKGPVNYTIVGSPTINNGIVSGFSSSDYLNTSSSLNINNFKGKIRAKLNSGNSGYRGIAYIGSSAKHFTIEDEGTNHIRIYYYDSQTSSNTPISFWNISQINGNYVDYFFEYDKNNNQLKFKVLDLQGNNIVAEQTYDNVEFPDTVPIKLGYVWQAFNGEIDLNETYIKINNTAWFGTSFSKVKINTGLTKYTVVGSPIINNGIVNGFSNSNYITTQNLPLTNNNFEFKFKFTTSTDITSEQFIFHHITSPSQIALSLHTNSKFVFYYLDSSGNRVYSYTNFTVQANTTYEFVAKNINNTIYWWAGTPDNLIQQSNVTINYSNYTLNKLKIGSNAGNSYFRGSIDLNASYIKINNGYFWRGSHQNINAWKIQQDNFSKYYTIVDGKLMWANPNIYLQSSGTQYIDIGMGVNGNITFDVKYRITNSTGTPAILGCRTGSSTPTLVLFQADGGRFDYGTSSVTIGRVGSGVGDYKISTKIENGTYYLYKNTTLIGSKSTQTFTQNNNLYLFSINKGDGTGTDNAFIGNIKFLKVWNNSIQVRNLVPVPKGLLIGNFVVPSNGMFDIVEQKFYENKGTGEFTIGGIPEDYIIEDGKMIWCNPNIYLESTGTQYIETNHYANGRTIIEGEFQLTDTATLQQRIFGCDASKTGLNYTMSIYINSSGKWAFTCKDDTGSWTATSVSKDANKHSYKLGFPCTYFYIDGNKTVSIPGTQNKIATKSLVVFASKRETGVIADYAKIKQFKFTIYENFLIKNHLVPIPKGMLIGDKIAPSNCMFDMVTQTFFENQGTGDFIIGGISGDYINVGDNIVWVDNNVYLKCNGAQYFDSGFKANQDTKVDIDYTPYDSGIMTLYSCRDGAKLNTFTCFSPVSGTSNTRYDYNTTQNTISSNPVSGIRRHILADKNKFYIDDVLKYTATYTNFQSINNMIFGCSYAPELGYDNYSKFKYHKIQLYDDSKLIRYFLPVNTNTVIGSFTVPAPGMWDAVTKRFYPNKGTGTFTYGKDS